MELDAFLSRLQKVRRTGGGNWLACCPAHEDRTPSLSVARGDAGGIVVRCFAGCSAEAIVGAAGLTLADLMPERLLDGREFVGPRPVPFPAADVLEALSFEAEVLCVVAGDIEQGKELDSADIARVRLARDRIDEGRRLATGRHLTWRGQRSVRAYGKR